MESNIENLEKVLNNNQEYVYVNTDYTKNEEETPIKNKINLDKEVCLDREVTSYDTDETKKETSIITEDDCNDSVLTLNKDDNENSDIVDENDNSDIVNENENIEINENSETNINVEGLGKFKEPELIITEKREYEEPESNEDRKESAVSNNKNNLSLKIDTESIINSPNRPQSINSASSTGSKLSSFVPTFTSLFTTTNRNLRSISSAYFNKSNRLSTPSTEVLDSPTHSTIDTGDEEANYLLARLEEQNNLLQSDPKSSSFETLRANFQAIKNKEKDSDLDWDFWGKVMVDYEGIARKQPALLTKKIRQGIPDSLRGTLWQLISKSKNPELEQTYAELLKENTTYEKIIRRDLSRTFPEHKFFKDKDGVGQESLFNVMKVYSLYDTELGYCQGLSFIVGPLLLNMPDEEAFCVLIRLMEGYNMRGLYTPNMEGLQLRLYQYDQLLYDLLPKVARHLENEGIRSTMYASQWFMTLFAYKFPLELVFRVLDVLFAEGYESIFRIAFALLKKNQDFILEFEFDNLIDFLKNGLFDIYDNDIDELINDASEIKIPKRRLDKLANHFVQMTKEFDDNTQKIDQIKKENRELNTEVQRLSLAVESLTKENTQLRNIVEDYKFEEIANKTLIDALQKQIEESEKLVNHTLKDAKKDAEEKVRIELDVLINRNIDNTRKNKELEERVKDLEKALVDIKIKYAESEIEKENYQRKWENLKRLIE